MTALLTLDAAQADPLEAIANAAAARVAALAAGRGPDPLARVDAAIELLDRAMPGRSPGHLPDELFDLAVEDSVFPALLTARLLATIATRRSARRVPDALVPELRRQAMRILGLGEASLTDETFHKDLSICQLLSIPCAAQIVVETGGIPRRTLATGGVGQALRLGRHLAATRLRSVPYLEIHTHTPMLGDFNPAGWDRCYELVAELLAARQEFLGMVGGSWFYDPAIAGISPHLTYLAETPVNGGAFRVRMGEFADDTEMATATSQTRRGLVEAGKYVPARWLLIWPRKPLLAWAASRR
jgi:hypothetical protein